MRTALSFALLLLSGNLVLSAVNPPSATELSFLPTLVSERGLTPRARESTLMKNRETIAGWIKQLTPDQRATWYTKHGLDDPEDYSSWRGQKLPLVESGYDWHAAARLAGLNEAEVTQLGRDKLLIEDISLPQTFSAYVNPQRPVFITSDSILDAFHVLFEDSFRALEIRRAFELRRMLEKVLTQAREEMADKNNPFPVADLKPGWLHAQLVVGPALRLLGTNREFFDPEACDEIDRQMEKIRAASAVELPLWLGAPSPTLPAIDYRRFKPVGFYTATAILQNYFQALRWLQSIPFRADRDIELTAIGLLGQATRTCGERNHAIVKYFQIYPSILGRSADATLDSAASEFGRFLQSAHEPKPWEEELFYRRLLFLFKADNSETLVDPSLRAGKLSPEAAKKVAAIQFRILSDDRLPDSLFITKTVQSEKVPSGLPFAVFLGSDFAKRHLLGTDIDLLETRLKAGREDWHPTDEFAAERSLYDDYLDTLTTLNAQAEPDAPAFMNGEPWKAKSCQTVLCSWTQMKPNNALRTRDRWGCDHSHSSSPGFVEPNPEFFRAFTALVGRTSRIFESGGIDDTPREILVERLRKAASDLESFGFHLPTASAKDLDRIDSTRSDDRYWSIIWSYGPLHGQETREIVAKMSDRTFQAFHSDLITQIRTDADDYSAGRRRLPESSYSSFHIKWTELEQVARRLEVLAHKQLRKQPWKAEEENFIGRYGETLGYIMGYLWCGSEMPRDDAPRWTALASDTNSGVVFAGAVGRPRLVHVLYPWKGDEILCTGSVMSYYEYAEKPALTDEEWKAKLDTRDAPVMPDWLALYVAK